MGLQKISKQDKDEFQEKSKKYKEKIKELESEKKMIQSLKKKNPDLEIYYQIKIGMLGIQIASVNTNLAILSSLLLNNRGDNFINDARKEIFGIFTNFLNYSNIDFYSTLTDNQEFINKISELDPEKRYVFLKGLYEITNRIYELELQGKYRWSFPEIYQKLALVMFLFLDFKLLEKTKNPDTPYYDSLNNHLELLIEVLQKSAQEYRSKYELASKDVDSLQNIQKILELLKKIYIFKGNKEETERVNLQIEATKEKIESILHKDKKQDKKK